MAELLRYQQLIMQAMGSNFYEPMDIMGWGQTWADMYSDMLRQAQEYSDAYFAQFRDEIREANDALIDAIRDLIDALTGAKQDLEGGTGNQVPTGENLIWYPGGGGQTQVNLYLDGSLSALRPMVRAEIRDSLAGRPRGIN